MKKLLALETYLRSLDSVVVAFSAGVDSTFLLAVAKRALGDKVLAVTARSSTYPSSELEQACLLAGDLGAAHTVIDSEELDVEGFSDNPPNRCYYCKKELFSKLTAIASELGYKHVVDGANLDDNNDYRPGSKAAEELGIKSPLRENGFTKAMIRECSAELGLPTADKPAYACLASRFPYHQKIDRGKLKMVELAEEYLKREGLRGFRVRCHDNIARLEIVEADRDYFNDESKRQAAVDYFKSLGFDYIALDLEAYRTGRMNEEILKETYGTYIIADLRIMNAYNLAGEFNKVVMIWKKIIEKSPNNAQYRVSFGAAYLQTGERAKAIEQLKKAIEIEPSFKTWENIT